MKRIVVIIDHEEGTLYLEALLSDEVAARLASRTLDERVRVSVEDHSKDGYKGFLKPGLLFVRMLKKGTWLATRELYDLGDALVPILDMIVS